MKRSTTGKGQMGILLPVTAVIVLLLFWVFLGSPDGAHKPSLPDVHVLASLPMTESSRMWPGTGAEFGDEGLAASMVATFPAPVQMPTSLGIVDPETDPGKPSFKVLKNILTRWGERVRRKVPITTSLSLVRVKPTVAVVGRCDATGNITKNFIDCIHCTPSMLESRLNKIQYEATHGQLLLIPHDKITEGLVLMGRVFDYYPGDLLHLLNPTDEKQECSVQSKLYEVAETSIKIRISEFIDDYTLQLDSYRRALKALPNYCQGMYHFSQCQLMNENYRGWERRAPSPPPRKFKCSGPDTSKIEAEEVPAGSTPRAADLGKQLIATAWPRCATKPGGCSPKQGIAFIKTHKTASSTLEGLLQRLCVTRRQKCFTHSGKFVNIAYGEQAKYISRPHKTAPALSPPYDMFIAHTMNTNDLTAELVPSSNGHVLTIVREPAARFKSHWNFWVSQNQIVAEGWPWTAGDMKKMCEEAMDPRTGPSLVKRMNQEPLNIRLALNNMARQLMGCTSCGTDAEIEARFQKLLRAIKEPNSKYHILISEKLHESLILFKKDYDLEMADLVYASRNMGSYKKEMPNEETECLHRINSYDYRLYEAAVEVHDRRVAAYGKKLQEEVEELDGMVTEIVKNSACSTWDCSKDKEPTSSLCTQCLDVTGQGKDPTSVLVEHFSSQCAPVK
eukprot:TRINITY_DN1498_c0_g1_i1.p1 TRINITY_DN1498_c0_g1~~TRINITY_DN1498_c0_g1_i1.p1  ORF type:complete len:676 (+),score=115.51 TRINITY_DN1498_c0_g1_i1:787-2814(+)